MGESSIAAIIARIIVMSFVMMLDVMTIDVTVAIDVAFCFEYCEYCCYAYRFDSYHCSYISTNSMMLVLTVRTTYSDEYGYLCDYHVEFCPAGIKVFVGVCSHVNRAFSSFCRVLLRSARMPKVGLLMGL